MPKRKPLSVVLPFTGKVKAVYKNTRQYGKTHAKAGQSFDIFTTILQPENPWGGDESLPEIWIESFGEDNRPKNDKGDFLTQDDSLTDYPLSISARGYSRQSDGRVFGEIKIYPAGQNQIFDDSDDSNLGEPV